MTPYSVIRGLLRLPPLTEDEEVAELIRSLPRHYASTPTFASVGHNGLLQLANADSTNLSAAIITGVAAGTRIKEIRLYSGPTTAPGTGILTLQITDGVTINVFEVWPCVNTANVQQNVFRYDNLILTGTGWTIKAQMRTAITSGGTIHISILGEDLT